MWEPELAAALAQLTAKTACTEAEHASAGHQMLLATTLVFTGKDSTDPTTGQHCIKSKVCLTVRGEPTNAADMNENYRASPKADLDRLRLLMAPVAGDPRSAYLQFDFVGRVPERHFCN